MEQERKVESKQEEVKNSDKKDEEASAPVFAIGGGSDSESEENW